MVETLIFETPTPLPEHSEREFFSSTNPIATDTQDSVLNDSGIELQEEWVIIFYLYLPYSLPWHSYGSVISTISCPWLLWVRWQCRLTQLNQTQLQLVIRKSCSCMWKRPTSRFSVILDVCAWDFRVTIKVVIILYSFIFSHRRVVRRETFFSV